MNIYATLLILPSCGLFIFCIFGQGAENKRVQGIREYKRWMIVYDVIKVEKFKIKKLIGGWRLDENKRRRVT